MFQATICKVDRHSQDQPWKHIKYRMKEADALNAYLMSICSSAGGPIINSQEFETLQQNSLKELKANTYSNCLLNTLLRATTQ